MKKSIRTIGYLGLTTAIILAFYQSSTDSLPEEQPGQTGIDTSSRNILPLITATQQTNMDTANTGHLEARANNSAEIPLDEYILSCEEQSIQYIHQGENPDQELTKYNQAIQHSNKPDEQLAYYLSDQEADASEAFEFLRQLNSQSPSNALAYDQLLNLCFAEENINKCDDELIEKATNVDPNNGIPWLNIAALHQVKGEPEKALEALGIAIKKPYFDDYHWQLIDFLEQVSDGRLNLSYKARLVSAIGIAAAKPFHFYKVIEMCKSSVANDPVQADVCLSLGKQMEKNSTTITAQGLGLNFQSIYYEATQDKDELALINKKQSRIYYDSQLNETTQKTWQLMSHDENLYRFWLKNMLEHGEIKGMQYVVEEAIWRSRNPNYNPCPNMQN